eukprot:2701429-Prymnesium_polylepis.2
MAVALARPPCSACAATQCRLVVPDLVADGCRQLGQGHLLCAAKNDGDAAPPRVGSQPCRQRPGALETDDRLAGLERLPRVTLVVNGLVVPRIRCKRLHHLDNVCCCGRCKRDWHAPSARNPTAHAVDARLAVEH